MSWITDIAGKAETFLNKIDQNTALLVETNIATDIQLEVEEEFHLKTSQFSSNHQQDNPILKPKSMIVNPMTLKPSKEKRKTKILSDSSSKDVSVMSGNVKTSVQPPAYEIESKDNQVFEQLKGESVPDADEVKVKNDENSASVSKEIDDSEGRAILVEENDAMKKKLESKQTELRQRDRRLKEYQDMVNNMRQQIILHENKIQSIEKQSNIDKDLIVSLDKELKDKSQALDKMADLMEQKFQEERQSLEKRIENQVGEMAFLLQRNESLQQGLQEKVTSLKDIHEDQIVQREKNSRLAKELEEFKAKAKRVFEDQERQISGYESSELLPSSFYKLQVDEITVQNNLLRDEAEQLTKKLQDSQEQVLNLENQVTIVTEKELKTAKELESAFHDAKLKSTKFEIERKTHEAEVTSLHEEARLTKLELMAQLRSYENEISSLKIQTSTTQPGPEKNRTFEEQPSETRIAGLQEALLTKQNLLEAVVAEKTSLVLKLEKVQKDLDDTLVHLNDLQSLNPDGSYSPSTFESDGIKWKVQKAYSSLDKLSMRIGTALRRYPMTRIFILIYMACLHLWVFVILFSSTSDLTLPPAR